MLRALSYTIIDDIAISGIIFLNRMTRQFTYQDRRLFYRVESQYSVNWDTLIMAQDTYA